MKTPDWSVETLGLDYNSTGLCNHFQTRVASETRLIYLVAVNEQTLKTNMFSVVAFGIESRAVARGVLGGWLTPPPNFCRINIFGKSGWPFGKLRQ